MHLISCFPMKNLDEKQVFIPFCSVALWIPPMPGQPALRHTLQWGRSDLRHVGGVQPQSGGMISQRDPSESERLEKTSDIFKSNPSPNTANPPKPYHKGPCLLLF